MKDAAKLERILGTWQLGPFTLFVDHVQADPFASLARYFFFGELPPVGVFAGALGLLAGVALAVRAEGK